MALESLISQIKAKNFKQVEPHLYRGGLPSENDVRLFKKLGIKTIIDFNVGSHPRERQTAEEVGIGYIHRPWNAYWHRAIFWRYYLNISEEFIKYVRDTSLWPLYVHCYHGRDRTGMLIAAYRMVHQNWTYQEALREMKTFGFNPILHFDIVLFLLRYRDHLPKRKIIA